MAPSSIFAAGEAEGDSVTAPSEIQLIPSGKKIQARDGRTFRNSEPKRIVEAFEKRGQPLPVDVDHATEMFGGPAVGWIESLSVRRGGSVWASVEWTPQGKELIESRAYRFVSPAMFHDDDGEVMELSSAAIVNNPALRLQALSSRQPQDGSETMSKAILAALGLTADADEDQAIAKIQTLALVDPTKYAKREDYDAEKARADGLHQRLAAFQQAARDDEVKRMLDDASKAGKITPAERDAFEAYAKHDIETVRAHIAKMSARVEPVADLENRKPTDVGTGAHGLTDQEIFVAAKLGIDPEAYATQKTNDEQARAARNAAASRGAF